MRGSLDVTAVRCLNMLRSTRHHAERRRACPVCGERAGVVSIPGELSPSTIAAERLVTGVCSVKCRQVFYGLGERECVCGNPVYVPGADCRECRRARRELDLFVLDEELSRYGVPTAPDL